jgi:hypothetical protein
LSVSVPAGLWGLWSAPPRRPAPGRPIYALVPWAANNTERHNPGDRFADDPAFAVHEGGKLKVCPIRPIRSIDDLALTYLSLTGLSASREH